MKVWDSLKRRLGYKKREIPTQELDGQVYLTDPRGRLIPVSTIPDIDLKRDALVRDVVNEAESIEERLALFKVNRIADIHTFVAMAADEAGVKLGGKKGNIQMSTFDGSMKIAVAISDYIEFDERLHAAKQLFDEMVNEGSEGSPEWFRTLIMDAFDIGKKGMIDTAKMLALTRIKIDHPKGQKAQGLILRSIRITGSKEYLRVYRRDEKTGKYGLINLDLARATCDTAPDDAEPEAGVQHGDSSVM